MVTDAFDVIDKLGAYVFTETVQQAHMHAGEHKVLPHDQAILVAQVKKVVLRVVSAAPHTDGIEIRGDTVLDQFFGFHFVDAGKDVVLRDIVRTHCKNFNSIDHKAKFFTKTVRSGADRQGAQADPFCETVGLTAVFG